MKTGLVLNTERFEWIDEVKEDLSFAGVLDALYQQRFTGAVTIHFKDGKPAVVDMPAPKIRLR